MKVFVPLNEQMLDGEMIRRLGLTMDDLVPFDLDYEVLRPELVAEQPAEAPILAIATA